MTVSAPNRLDARTRRRQLLRLDRRQARARARLRKGQTLIIFALSVTMLLGFAGIAIDIARAYDLYAKMQRAADAGAIAGVLYMPTYYNAARPGDGQSAVSRAIREIYKDGFGSGVSTVPAGNPCPTPYSSVEIAVCQIPNASTDVEVIITEQVNLVLLDGLGFSPITLQVHSQAEYLPPIQIGSRESYFGDEVECSPGNSSNTNTNACSPGDTTQNHLQYFMASMQGPADLKESGDPFVYCAEGDAEPFTGTDPSNLSYTYNGYPTDHQQWSGIPTGITYTGGISQYCGQPVPGGNPGNPDYQPPGYDGPATAGTPIDGGYNYYIGIMPGVATSTLWLYNPFYIPQDANNNPLDSFTDNTLYNASAPGTPGTPECTGSTPPNAPCWSPNFYQGPAGKGIGTNFDGVHHDAPIFYYSVTYTLYQVGSLYDRSQDGCGGVVGQACAVETFSAYDNTSTDLAYHGCTAGSQVYDPYWSGKNTPNFYHNPNQVTPGQGCVSSTALPGECSFNANAPGWCALEKCGIGLDPSTNPEKDLLNKPQCATPGQVTLQPGNAYRLVVEATGVNAGCVLNSNGVNCDYTSSIWSGWGRHTYALKICAATGLSTPINCPNGDGSNGAGGFNNNSVSISGWNNDVVTVREPLSTASANANLPQTSCVQSNANPYACIDLGCIPSLYAGRTVTVGLFDPGEGSGNLYVGVVQPPNSGSTVHIGYPTYTKSMQTTLDGDLVVQTSSSASSSQPPFNGLWLKVNIQLGSAYQGDCFSTGAKSGKSGFFQIAYVSDGSVSATQGQLGVKFDTVGSPVHLVPPQL